MGFDRRTALAGGIALATCWRAEVAAARTAGEDLLYLGAQSGGVRAARFNPASGGLTMIGAVMDNPRPSWALRHPRLPVLYINEDVRDAAGRVHAMRIDRKTGALSAIASVEAGGKGNTHMTTNRAARTLLSANFTSGSLTTIALGRDGTPGGVISTVQLTGSGPHVRQKSPHAHGVYLDASERWALVCDLGADRVWVIPFDSRNGRLGAYDPASASHYVAPPGSGPRHGAWHPGGRYFYLVNELSASITTLAWNTASGSLTKVQELSTDAPGYAGNRSAAEVVITPDGRFVYVSNRGDHVIAVYAVNRVDGTLSLLQRAPAVGTFPWHIALHRSGRWLLVANRDTDSINVLRRNSATGLLSDSGQSLATPRPVVICMAG